MNKQRIHDILSSIQMSPRDKKDLVNAIANSGGINNNTPIKESVDGTELVPIFDGENKAVSVNKLVKDGKEVYVLDATRTDYETLFNEVSEAWDSNKQIILNYNPPIFDTLLTKGNKDEYSINFAAGPVIMPHFYGNGCFMTPMLYVSILKDGIKLNDTLTSEFTEENLGFITCGLDDKIALTSNGDGTQFLSDDGTYKTISTSNSSIPQLNSMFYVETNNVVFDSADIDTLNNNRKVILTLQYGSGSASTYEYIICDVIYRSASTNTYQPTIIGHYFYNNKTYIVTFTAVKSGGNISVSPICIDDLNTKVNDLESRIAALEGATA